MNTRLQDALFLCDPYGTDAYAIRTRVRVLRGPRKGQLAVVYETTADGGDMLHACRFEDGATETYNVDEITALTGNQNTHT
jgi:hypothetical protein